MGVPRSFIRRQRITLFLILCTAAIKSVSTQTPTPAPGPGSTQTPTPAPEPGSTQTTTPAPGPGTTTPPPGPVTTTPAPGPGPCVTHFNDPDGQTFGSQNAINAKRTRNEADPVDVLIYQITWDEGGSPGDIQGDIFKEYYDVNSSVPNSWKITLKKALTGLPDYPEPQDTLTAISTFTGYTDYKECVFTLTISIEDANTQPPEFEENSYTVSIREDFPVGFDVTDLNVNITDNDFREPNNIVDVTVDADCHLIPNPTVYQGFLGDFKRVNFQLSKALDFEVEPNLSCDVTLTDQGVPPLSNVITVKITVDDVQDEPPIFTSILYSAVVDSPEPAEGGTPLSTDPKPIEATDGDTGSPSPITYSMDDYTPEIVGTDYFTINSESGVVKLMKLLDDDMLTNEKVTFVLKATDASGDSATSALLVTLPPVPTTTPEPTTTPSTTPTTTPDTTPTTTPDTTPTTTPDTTQTTTPTTTSTPTASTTESTDSTSDTESTRVSGMTESTTSSDTSDSTTASGMTESTTTPDTSDSTTGTTGSTTSPGTTEMTTASGMTGSTTSSGTTEVTTSSEISDSTTASGMTGSTTSPGTTEMTTASGMTGSTTSSGTTEVTTASGTTEMTTASGTTGSTTSTGTTEMTTVSGMTGSTTASGMTGSTISPGTTGSTTPSGSTSTLAPEATLSFTKDSWAAEIYESFPNALTVFVNVHGIEPTDVILSLDGADAMHFNIESSTGMITVVKPLPDLRLYTLTAIAQATSPTGTILNDTSLVQIYVYKSAESDISLTESLHVHSLGENITDSVLFSIGTVDPPPVSICISNVPEEYKDCFETNEEGTEGWQLIKKGPVIDYESTTEVRFLLQAFDTKVIDCQSKTITDLLRSEALVIISIDPVNDNDPRFITPSAESESIAYPKDVALQKVVGPIVTLQAEDDDVGTVLEYSITSATAGFSVEKTTGAIYVEGPFDCGGDGCQIKVKASDGERMSQESTINVKSLDMNNIYTITMDDTEASAVDEELKQLSTETNVHIMKVYVNPEVKLKSDASQRSRYRYYSPRRPYAASTILRQDESSNAHWQIEVNVYAMDNDGMLLTLEDFNQKLSAASLGVAVPFVDQDTFSPAPDVTDTTGLIAGISVLAVLLAIVLAAGGFLMYRKRKAMQNQPKNISSVGSSYPYHSFSDEGTETKSTLSKKTNGYLNGSLGKTEAVILTDNMRDSPPLHRSALAATAAAEPKNDAKSGLRRTNPGSPEYYGNSSREPPPAYSSANKKESTSTSNSSSATTSTTPVTTPVPSLYPALVSSSKETDGESQTSAYLTKNPKKAPPPLTSAPARSILRGNGGTDTKEDIPLFGISSLKKDPSKIPATDYNKTPAPSSSKFAALKGSPTLKKASAPIDSDGDSDAKRSNLKVDKADSDSEDEKKSVAFKVLVDLKVVETENPGPSQKAAAVAAAKSDALEILQANQMKLTESDNDDDHQESAL